MEASTITMGAYHRAVADHWENDPRARAAAKAVQIIAENVREWQRKRVKTRARQKGREFSRSFNTIGAAMGRRP